MRERIRLTHPSGGESRVKQADSKATDINRIMDRWVTHGVPVPAVGGEPSYGDFSMGLDFHEALNRVSEAESDFMKLPAPLRAHVENDPGLFLDLVFDPDRRGELEELGLIPTRAPVAAPPASKPPDVEAPAEEPVVAPVSGGE